MTSTALLVVSNVKQIKNSLKSIEKYVRSLYIHLNIPVFARQQPVPTWGRLISQLYVDSTKYLSKNVDMNVLVGPIKNEHAPVIVKPIDMIFSDSHFPELCERLRTQFNISSQTIYLQQDGGSRNDIAEFQPFETPKIYDSVVLGGTFDRIHIGHKIFLTQAVLRARKRLVVGVTMSALTKAKILQELILPVEQRISDVGKFLSEIDATLEYDVVPIDDPFGPTKTDPNMDMIVVSAETLRGGHKVNEIRAKNNLRPLEIFCIELVESDDMDGPKESKVSSSNTRIDLLGRRLRQPESRPHLPKEPYIIGLTGCIASGKSKMAQRFQNMGAQVIDCDKIAHELYEPGKICFEKVIKEFGEDILSSDGRVDRTKLGSIVFADPEKLKKLNNIVWSELNLEAKRRIQALYSELKCKVVVLEAAVLLKAGWESECHEVWSMIVPPEVAVQRVIERNGLKEDDARKRIANQLTNEEIVAKSHVVFSSEWESEFTQKQAEKAWAILMSELGNKTNITNASML